MDLILFGMQGSGKGTQARLLLNHEQYHYFSVGDILREITKHEESRRSNEIKRYINNGKLVPDTIIFSLLHEFLDKAFRTKKPILFDGLPRNKIQYKTLRKILEANNRDYISLYYDLPLTETLARIEARRLKSNETEEVREDDKSLDKILTRLEAFFVHTFPAVKEALLEDKVIVLDATPAPDKIFKESLERLRKREKSR